ncbi:MAG: hypothetical protein ABI551_00090 [Polyangiaceae bacterium]
MRRALALGLVFVALAVDVPSAAADGPKLPSLPNVARIRFDVAADHVVVLEEVNLPKGEWAGGDMNLFVAFGAPGLPLALDASIVALADGAIESNPKDAGEPLAFDRAPKRPSNASLLLGSPQMAGVVLRLKEASFKKAVSLGKMAAIRIRSVIALPAVDAQDGRELVVRLGIVGGPPLTLGRLQLAFDGVPLKRVEAHFCGPDADDYPLSIAVTPKLATSSAQPALPSDGDVRPPAAPVLSVRHPSDDLCVRMW